MRSATAGSGTNPIESVRQSAKRQRIPVVLDTVELVAILEVLVMFTGLRSSDLLALKWSDFDFKKMEFWVRSITRLMAQACCLEL